MRHNFGYFKKEMQQAYSEYRISVSRLFSYGVFIGLVSFAVHFLLQTMYETVLTESLPELMLPSYFSVIFAYTNIAYIFFLVYFLAFYNYLTFSEIRNNSWYLLTKMGYRPLKMILIKLMVRMISVVITYTVGFLIAILLTTFLKYPFIVDYFFPSYLAGLVDVLIIVMLTMTLSLFFRRYDNTRIIVVSAAIVVFGLKISTGYYDVVSNRERMKSLINLVDIRLSPYFIFFAAFVLACLIICLIRARGIARYYSIDDVHSDTYAVQDYRTDNVFAPKDLRDRRLYKVVDVLARSVLFVVIVAGILLNLIILTVSLTTPDREVNFWGYIPYVFQSNTMQPDIMRNDLILFKAIDSQYPLHIHDVVLYRDNKDILIQRVIDVNGDTLSVDIDHYPPQTTTGAMAKEINQGAVYGLYFGGSRWLGALVVFANTIFGRVLFLFVPAILIFFYKPIVSFFRSTSKAVKSRQ